MARSIPAHYPPTAENPDGSEKPVHMEATDARSGSRDRDVFVVLTISTVLAVLAMLGALAYYSGALSGFGGQTRSPSTFEQPNNTQTPSPTLPTSPSPTTN
jgi:hypothetical protein